MLSNQVSRNRVEPQRGRQGYDLECYLSTPAGALLHQQPPEASKWYLGWNCLQGPGVNVSLPVVTR